MNATSTTNVTNNQLGSADAKSEEAVEGLGNGVGPGDAVKPGDGVGLGDGVAASTTPLKVFDAPCDKLTARTPNTTYLPSPPHLGSNVPAYGLA
jgi:hypothetical protein